MNLRLGPSSRVIIIARLGGREGKNPPPQDQKEASETMGKVGRREDLLGSVRGQGKVTMQ